MILDANTEGCSDVSAPDLVKDATSPGDITRKESQAWPWPWAWLGKVTTVTYLTTVKNTYAEADSQSAASTMTHPLLPRDVLNSEVTFHWRPRRVHVTDNSSGSNASVMQGQYFCSLGKENPSASRRNAGVCLRTAVFRRFYRIVMPSLRLHRRCALLHATHVSYGKKLYMGGCDLFLRWET